MERRIGKYLILSRIGTGGFGTVYRARDPELERDVALKVLSTTLLQSESDRKRFFQEARVAAALAHPNIVVIHELGTTARLPYIAMEYLPGSDLRALLREKHPLSLRQKLNIALQVARALRHAHAHNVIHRDVKPENIRIQPSGLVKLMDFGIAKLTGEERSGQLTTTGSVLGSASYMSPEQARGEPLTAASDVFSFGVVLYELLTYRRPFTAPSLAGLIYRILTDEPPPIDEPEGPEDLRKLVFECLRKPRAERPPSFEPIVQRLTRLRQQLQSEPDPPRTEESLTLPAAQVEAPIEPEALSGATTASDPSRPDEETSRRPLRPAAVGLSAGLALALLAALVLVLRAGRAPGLQPLRPTPADAAPSTRATDSASAWPASAQSTSGEAPAPALLAPTHPPTPGPSLTLQAPASPTASPTPPPTPPATATPSPNPVPASAAPAPPSTGTLRLSVEPVAWVQIDENPEIRSPLPPLPLTSGLHRLRLRRDGFRRVDRMFELAAGQSLALHVVLEPLRQGSALFVLYGPAWAFLQIDEGPELQMPLAPVTLLEGRHTVRAYRPGWRPVRREFFVAPDAQVSVSILLEPDSTPLRNPPP